MDHTNGHRPAAFDPRLPFSRAEARAAGISVKTLSSKRFQKIAWDIYLDCTVKITPQIRSRAAMKLAPPGSHISHHTAAELWNGRVTGGPITHVTMPTADRRLVRKGIKSHYYDRHTPLTTMRHGLPVSTPEQVLLDLATVGMPLVDLVVVLDGMIKAEHTSPEALIKAAEGWTGPGRKLALRAASLARAGVDSPMETRLRLLIVFAGLPEPRTNLIMRGRDGQWQRRYDLAYEGLRLIIEYEGRQHAEDTDQWTSDIYRREELDRMHWRLVLVTKDGIYKEPLRTLERVRDALLDCGATGIRGKFKPEWRLHFPGI
jgi:AbiEi antitoxin C-terminal domain